MNGASADDDLRSGALTASAPPNRLYVNLTEICQLKCAHCITGAPQMTDSGSARSLSAQVLEALTPHLAHVSYLGLTHAGEPMLGPQFVPLLRALRRQRAGKPTVVHLITNGMALTPKRFEELVGLGVCSWSFSIDGMTPATNDALRVGSRIEVLKERIPALCRLRTERGFDARMGLSWTLTRSNLHELPALVDFASAAGLNWLKLEETYPINARAEEEARIAPEQLRAAVAQAVSAAQRLKLPVVDHTHPVEVWKCRPAAMSDAAARFSNNDSLANRMEINPCRLPWEIACIEPNGEVKPTDFHQPSAGNLLTDDLLQIWNSEPFVRTRLFSRARRLCGTGPVSCPRDSGAKDW
jgi:MoaA/NifB/PqqE/SkfB family radical SAM enzyme